MQKRSNLEYIKLENLDLDMNNPRFADLYSGSKKEEDLIEYLLYEEAAEDVAQAIVRVNEFYEDKALWVIKKDDGNYLVRDGNRRCAAVKALQIPGKYKLSFPKTVINELPVYLYQSNADLNNRIVEEHAGSLFRRWERIAKALQVLDLADTGRFDETKELDSKPGDLIKLASFYKKAVLIGKDTLKHQLRRGRGKTGGKTIIYERLFKYAKLCGYYFKNSPSFKIEITDKVKFDTYIDALVKYLEANPGTTTDTIDKNSMFLKELKAYGFDAYPKVSVTQTQSGSSQSAPNGQQSTSHQNSTSTNAPTSAHANTVAASSASPSTSPINKRGTIKKYPDIKRKQLPPGLKARIDEYFDIDSNTMPNAKVAMARVTYECILKYVVENTKNGNISFHNSGHFGPAYSKRPYTNFEELNKKFIELINNTGYKQAFINFEFDKMHQTIHNYHVSSKSIDAEQIKNNLIILIEFMLQDVIDLLNSLDLTKIK